MDRDGPFRVLTDVQEPSHDVVAGGAAVYEEQVVVLKASVCEALRLVNLFVQSHDCRHVVLFEIRKVGFGGMERVTYRQTGAVSRVSQTISNKQYSVRISLLSGGKIVSGECESPQGSRLSKAAADLTINTRGNNNEKKKKTLLCVGKSSLKVKVATSVIQILERNLEPQTKAVLKYSDVRSSAGVAWGDISP